MNDEELLKRAERLLLEAKNNPKIDTDVQMQTVHTASIAASLLVIARNSVEKTDYKEAEPKKSDGVSVEPRAYWIAKRLETYKQYWDDFEKVYHIANDWNPTRNELLADIEKSYYFEVLNIEPSNIADKVDSDLVDRL